MLFLCADRMKLQVPTGNVLSLSYSGDSIARKYADASKNKSGGGLKAHPPLLQEV